MALIALCRCRIGVPFLLWLVVATLYLSNCQAKVLHKQQQEGFSILATLRLDQEEKQPHWIDDDDAFKGNTSNSIEKNEPEEEEIVDNAISEFENDCKWTKPQGCGKKSYKIDYYIINSNKNDASSSSSPSETVLTFPEELKRSFHVAANMWSRVIKGRPQKRRFEAQITTNKDSNTFCGMPIGTKLIIEGILICLNYSKFNKDDRALASASYDAKASTDHLPLVATININSNYYDAYDRCDWNNVMLHELGHALGFREDVFEDHGLLYENSNDHDVFIGQNAKIQWGLLWTSSDLSSNKTKIYPKLFVKDDDRSHWPYDCFNISEIMEPYLDSSIPKGRTTNSRMAITRLTLSVMDDLGYDIDYNCVDEDIHVVSFTCLGGEGPADPRRSQRVLERLRTAKEEEEERVTRRRRRRRRGISRQIMRLRKTVRQGFQTRSYLYRVRLRELKKNIKKKIRKSKKIVKAIMRKQVKQGYKLYRRIRRSLKARIREALSCYYY